MISIARGFGAPDSVPAGKQAATASNAVRPAASAPGHRRDQVHDVAVALDARRSCAPSTVPGSQTRPRSLRPRSTSMRCSARSFSSVQQVLLEQRVVLLVVPRASGCRRWGAWWPRPSRTVTSASGLEPTMSKRPPGRVGEAQQVHVRAGVGRAQHAVDVERVGAALGLEPLRHHDLERLAGADLLLGGLDGGVVLLGRAAAADRRGRGW